MNIAGLGTDIVEIDRISGVISRHQESFAVRVCTAKELQIADGKKDKTAFFAGRWAAKEAAAKALGCGIGENCAFTDIEILNDERGCPVMSFSGAAAVTAGKQGITDIKVSISHEKHYAVATVILSNRDI